MKNSLVVSIMTTFLLTGCSVICFSENEPAQKPDKEFLLRIVNFTESSFLKATGAQVGDILVSYDGKKVTSLKQLQELKSAVQTPLVSIVLKRDNQEITVKLPSGQLGAFFKETLPEYKVDPDAVIIKDIEPLDWGIGEENSFIAAVQRINKKFGEPLTYPNLAGLSGYAFRFHFFEGWCPSSPDATCGKDVGSELLKKLGYDFEAYAMKTKDIKEKDKELAKTEDELRKLVKKSLDAGWPVLAIDLIDVPEWGVITGYQKDGKEFFCRTYYDRTDGYDIAEKFPWVIYVIKARKKVDLEPGLKASLLGVKELYSAVKFDKYANGLTGFVSWIKALQDEESFKKMDGEQLSNAHLANWWIYHSLSEARRMAVQYLAENKNRFGIDGKVIDNLIKMYGDEMEILKKGIDQVPCPLLGAKPSDWNPEQRKSQIKTIGDLLEIEKKVNEIFQKI